VAEAQADTIRLKLLKIAAQVRITARRIWVRYSCAYPWQKVSPRPGRRCAAEKEERIKPCRALPEALEVCLKNVSNGTRNDR